MIQRVRSLAGHDWATNFAFDCTGEMLASGGGDKTIRVWDLNSGRLLRTLEGHTGAVVCMDFLPKTKLLATKSRASDNTIRLWHAETGACVAIFSEFAGNVCFPSLAFHPHLPVLATVGSDDSGVANIV